MSRPVRFNFGDNWQAYAAGLTDEKITEADKGLRRLLQQQRLDGLRMIDIGCGSGVHALAAVRMGAQVTAIDIDPQSVATTQAVLQQHAPQGGWRVEERSILDVPAREKYDIVYSWGVLHHTGRMWAAMDRAAAMVAPGGRLVIALYKKTPCCGFWRGEKAVYSRLPRWARVPVTAGYAGAFLLAKTVTGHNPLKYLKNYKSQRGMSFWHDCVDWLGGYPYESAVPAEVQDWAARQGLRPERVENTERMAAGGLFGSGCAEYVFTRPGL